MSQIYIKDISKFIGEEIVLKGWVYDKTHKGRLLFLLIRDGTGIIQGVISKGDFQDEEFHKFTQLTQESSIIVKGVVRKDERAPSGYELSINKLKIVQLTQNYPITPKEHGISFLMDNRHLWLRSKRQNAILRIRSEVIKTIHDFFEHEGFILIDAPIFTPSSCESTTDLFETQYFDDKAYLTQSGQLYMEAACVAFGKVYCFGPTFRAERSKTRRHLTEFWMVEPEIAYAGLDDVIELAERLVSYTVERVLANREEELKILERDTRPLEGIVPPFSRITYTEAIKIINEESGGIKFGDDFGGDEETVISTHFPKPVVVHRYPVESKAFYMKPDPEDPRLALNFDMFAKEGYGEIIGGSQRIDDLELLEKRIEKNRLEYEAFKWYLDLRRYGSCPHAGFGLGLERLVAWLCKLDHVRESIPFPRLMYRLYP